MGYVPADWGSFGTALAAVAGAVTGLLFVALSVKGTKLTESRALSSRAAETLVLFMTSVLIALVVVAPRGQVVVGHLARVIAASRGGLWTPAGRRSRQPLPRISRALTDVNRR